MKQVLKNAKAIIAILILAISLNGCENNNDDLPEVIAGFTHTINEITGTVTFINTTTDATKYIWDFGDGTTSTEINPIKSYASGTYTIVLRAFNVSGASDTYEDTITILRKGPATLPINFDEVAVVYNVTAFDGAAFEIIENPSVSGTNNITSKVGKITNVGVAYEGIFMNLGTQVDLTSNKTIKMNFWSNSAVDVLLKLENGTAAAVEKTTRHTGTGWETISFDFNSSAKYSKLAIFVDGIGTKAGVFYIDDIIQIQTPPPPCLDETAESMSAASLNVTFKSDQTANIIKDGTSFQWVSNPNNTGINTSCKVGNVTNLGIAPWDNVQINLDAKLDFTSHSGFKIKVYSAKAGTKLTIKLEEIGNPGNNTEVGVVRTKTNEWEELTVPFPSTASGKYNKIVLFFDLENKDSDTYYFDDLIFYGSGSGTGGGGGTAAGEIAQNGGFETGDLSNWAVYNNGGTVSAVTTQPSTGTYCAMLVASPTGLNPTLKQERKGAGTLTVGDKVKITFDYKGSAAGGGIYSIQSFVEATNGVNQTVNISINPTSTWQTYTTTYTVAAGDVSGGVTLEFVAICGGVAGCSSTLYIDNASLIINP